MPQEPKSVKESFIQFNIRLPEFVKKQMERAGKKNVRSQNEEAIYRLHNFTEHEVMIAEIRSEMKAIRDTQLELMNEIKALHQKIDSKL